MPLTLRSHRETLSLCQLPVDAPAPAADILMHPMTAFFRTHDEATLLCPTALAPKNAKTESGFIAIEVVGQFAFEEIGILTQVANPLAAARISIVPFSSFNTDYILIKVEQRETAIAALKNAGHEIDATS